MCVAVVHPGSRFEQMPGTCGASARKMATPIKKPEIIGHACGCGCEGARHHAADDCALGVSGVVEMRGGTLERCSSEISTRFFCLQWAGSRRVGGFRVYDHGPVVACGTGMLAAGVVGASRSPVLAMVICEAGSER